ncbi:hypothetical protein LINPERPRIM_LOCUS22255 [Linum perenne]
MYQLTFTQQSSNITIYITIQCRTVPSFTLFQFHAKPIFI